MRTEKNKTKGLILLGAMMFFALSCTEPTSLIEEEIQRQAEQAKENLQSTAEAYVEEKIDEQTEKAQDYIESTRQSIVDSIEEFFNNLFDGSKQWLGIDAPPLVGQIQEGTSTETAGFIISSTYIETYKNNGGSRLLGQPTGPVVLIDGALIQYFEGGTNAKSIIIMEDGTGFAYVVYGAWLEVFEHNGGSKKAGFPISDVDKWGVNQLNLFKSYGKGKTQLFSQNFSEYALMQPNGGEFIFIVPPDVWKIYKNEGLVSDLGYPISSLPLDLENDYLTQLAGFQEIKEILQRQTYKIQIFENGSFWLDKKNSSLYNINYAQGVKGGQTGALKGCWERYKKVSQPVRITVSNQNQTGGSQ